MTFSIKVEECSWKEIGGDFWLFDHSLRVEMLQRWWGECQVSKQEVTMRGKQICTTTPTTHHMDKQETQEKEMEAELWPWQKKKVAISLKDEQWGEG